MTRRTLLGAGALTLTAGACVLGAENELRVENRNEGDHYVIQDDQVLFAYRHRLVSPPDGVGPLFERNAYLHPIYAPNGALVTDDFAGDHPHQRGVFFAWTKTHLTLDGKELTPDFWNLGGGTGRIVGTKVTTQIDNDSPPRLEARHDWQARRGDEWVSVLEETWKIEAHPWRGDRMAPDAAWYLDLTSRQRPKVDLELPEYRYGGMAVRGARDWQAKAPIVRTSEAKDRITSDGSRGRWIDMQGPIGERRGGIALLGHPSNLDAPQPIRMHPDVPYYVFTPPKSGAKVLKADKEHVFRYRLVVHNALTPEALEKHWKDYSG